jgi:hypothetical protein
MDATRLDASRLDATRLDDVCLYQMQTRMISVLAGRDVWETPTDADVLRAEAAFPLHTAVVLKQDDVVEQLLREDPERINSLAINYMTILHLAAAVVDVSMYQYLVMMGADTQLLAAQFPRDTEEKALLQHELSHPLLMFDSESRFCSINTTARRLYMRKQWKSM